VTNSSPPERTRLAVARVVAAAQVVSIGAAVPALMRLPLPRLARVLEPRGSSPSNVDAAASIMMIAGVALGGRASLMGPALGAIVVGYGQSTLSEQFPTQWTYFQGALFIVVILFLPGGVASLWPKLKGLWTNRTPKADVPAVVAEQGAVA